MGKVSGNWITGAHSGRACRRDEVLKCQSVKLVSAGIDSTLIRVN